MIPWSKLTDTSREAFHEYCRAWDYAQANDTAILEGDPQKDRVLEAVRLRKSDPERGFAKLLPLAKKGSAWGMLHVAWCYHHGRGVEVSRAAAEDWYRRAYEAGSQRAMLDYGRMLARRGDVALRGAVYGAGADRNWAPALYRLARLRLEGPRTQESFLDALPLLEQAARLGSPAAQWALGYYMVRGRFGLLRIPRGFGVIGAFAFKALAELQARAASGPAIALPSAPADRSMPSAARLSPAA